MNESSAYVGLDVHKDTIAVAVALPGREEPVYRGEIQESAQVACSADSQPEPARGGVEFLLRGRSVRVRGVSGDHRDGPPMRGGGTEPDPAPGGGTSEDRPARTR